MAMRMYSADYSTQPGYHYKVVAGQTSKTLYTGWVLSLLAAGLLEHGRLLLGFELLQSSCLISDLLPLQPLLGLFLSLVKKGINTQMFVLFSNSFKVVKCRHERTLGHREPQMGEVPFLLRLCYRHVITDIGQSETAVS